MKAKFDVVVTVLLVACALVTTGILVQKQFFAAPMASTQADAKPVFVEDWRARFDSGIRMGPPSAVVQLVEFGDFECPFCATFHRDLKELRDRYPSQVALTYIQYPLPMHRFAEPAARVAECAGQQGRFEAMHDQLFEQQTAFGLKPWSKFATEAGVPDQTAFAACLMNKDPVPAVVAGRKLGQQLDVKGTPALIVNGWKLAHPPKAEELDRMVKAILDGKSPVAETDRERR